MAVLADDFTIHNPPNKSINSYLPPVICYRQASAISRVMPCFFKSILVFKDHWPPSTFACKCDVHVIFIVKTTRVFSYC